MKAVSAALPLLICLTLTSCAGHYSAGGSFVGNLPKGAAPQEIAAEATNTLAILYPAGRTSLNLISPKNRNDFSQGLENSLRTKGFALSSSGSVAVAYVLDELRGSNPPSWYLQLRISDQQGSKIVNRTYDSSGQPEAGFSGIQTKGD